MEGKLRKVSELELLAYRCDPEKIYADLMSGRKPQDAQKLLTKMMALQSSPLAKRIQQRAGAKLPPDPNDSAVYKAQMNALLAENHQGLSELQSMHVGLSKDGQELSLHKSWHCLHFLLTGQGSEPVDSTLGKAIMGGEEIPDHKRVMAHGPVRFLTPDEVRQVAQALSVVPIRECAAAFDSGAAEQAKVYVPNHEPEELITYLFRLTRGFLS